MEATYCRVSVDTNWDSMERVVIYFEEENHSICLGVEDDHMKPESCCRFWGRNLKQ